MDPVFEEMRRTGRPTDIRPDVWRRWVSYVCDTVQPQLDELAAYKAAEVPTLLGGRPRAKGAA